MTVGRFTGGWFIDRYSRVAVVRASANGALGIGLIIFVDSAWVAGRLLYSGMGASLGFPLTTSCRQRYRPQRTNRCQRGDNAPVYPAFLVGLPLLGGTANIMIRSATPVVLALLFAAIVAKAVAKPDTKNADGDENS